MVTTMTSHDGAARRAASAAAATRTPAACALVCLLAALVWAHALRATGDAHVRRDNPPVTQLIQSGDYLVWLDAEARAIYRVRKPAAGKTPQGQHPAADERETLWQGEPLSKPTGIAADKAGVIYVTDERTESIYSLKPDGLKPGGGINVVFGVAFSGRPLKNPSALTVSDDGIIYVADGRARGLFSFDRARKEVVTEYEFGEGRVVDRLFYDGSALLGVDRASRVLYRFVTVKAEHPPDEQPGTEWRHVESEGHATVGRGLVTDLTKTVDELSDAGVGAGVVYLLDSPHASLVLLPSGGGLNSSLPTNLLAENPAALAAGDDSLYFAEGVEAGRFKRAPALTPLTLYFVGDWTASDVVELYRYLNGIGMLPLKEYRVEKPTTLEEFTKAQEIMPTGYVDEFQVLFCETNPSLCTAEQRRPLQKGAEQPPGYAVRLGEGARVRMPALPTTSRVTRRNLKLPLDPKVYKPEDFAQYFKSALGPIAREMAPTTLDDGKLRKLISEYNPAYKGENILAETQGSFGIPVSAGSVRIVVPSAELLDPNSGISRLAAKKNVSGFSPAKPPQQQSVPDNAPRPTAPPLYVADDCQPPDAPNAVLNLIKYCRPDLPRRPAVGIIDNFFNENHPAFAEPAFGGRSALHVYKPSNPTGESTPLEVERPNPNFFVKDLDHGTHIAGIIGARPQAGGAAGIIPQAELFGLTVDNLTQIQEDDTWSKIRLFNVSLGERHTAAGGQLEAFSGTDVLKEFMTQYNNILFVVSAGNEGRPLQNGSLAWLGYLDNVIVVGATNVPPAAAGESAASPVRLLHMSDGSGSNYDKARVGLVAPGERIVSTLFNGQYGEASGTSQATAFVTAAAAALMAEQPSWEPWQIKFRLVATADLWTATDMGNSVFSGELNFRRALLDRESVVIQREGAAPCTGQLDTTSLGRNLEIRQGATKLSIPFDRLLRVRRNRETSTDYTVIYYIENSPDDYPDRVNRYLRREVNVPATQMRMNYKFNFIPAQNSATCRAEEVSLKELVDFINSINP